MKEKLIIFMVLCFALLQTPTAICSAKPLPKTKKFTFDEFIEGADNPSFKFSGNSSIDQKALQLTPDNENQENGFNNKSGRIMYHQPFKLWSSDDVVASFNTLFVINMFRNKDWDAGEGLAFLIAPDYNLPEHGYGQWLGLTNATTDGEPGNRMVAIEFDTKKQGFDPIGNHIGLDINSVISNKTVPLPVEIEPNEKYNVWIEYDGESKLMEVYMAHESDDKPVKPVLSEAINLKHYVEQVSYFGFSGSTGDPARQFNCVVRWELEVEDLGSKKVWKGLVIGVSVGLPLFGFVLVLLGLKLRWVYLKKKRRAQDEESNVLGTLKRLPGMPREFKYKDLKGATNNFDESMILGKGGFGVVYRGVLREDNGRKSNTGNEVAVKKFSRDSVNGKEDFLSELTIIHRLRHKHLVRLVGWCYEKGKLLLVYDYMPNGSVEKHLYKSSNLSTLYWRHRYKILTGVASALHYLHNDYDQKVVHRDLKASNILLDSNYNARLGDFGLARALENERNSYAELELAGVPGTMGYVAPECFHTGKASPESDVFGFGAVVLEVVTGRSPGVKIQHDEHQLTLVDWVWMLHREGRIQEAVDERLNNEYEVDEAIRLLLLGLACSHPVASERPQTQAICQIIAETLPPPRVPPFKPVFTWPSLMSTTVFISNESSFSNILSNGEKHGYI
ncbi:Mitogen-activated protein kinase kinase kinase [Trema orientale]|uniref:Mitogen-activated protein kinase kinase kinase n=1 Tax=Trema orientale TaxID=63057 RepID=A0A2P5BHR9_TREOI|nr:Mitogen-activated protein kinase kinase kinase [Trema orientale]